MNPSAFIPTSLSSWQAILPSAVLGNEQKQQNQILPATAQQSEATSSQQYSKGWDSVSMPEPPALPRARSVVDLYETIPASEDTLLGNRFLCRGGGMLFIGPSGVGKSSASMQQDILWALGQSAFGISPARALKVLTIQAENDDGDLKEMVQGVVEGCLRPLNLCTPDAATWLREYCRYVSLNDRTGGEFLDAVEALLSEYRPDLLRLDHLTAYCGFDPVESGSLNDFLRQGLNPLLSKYGCGAIVNHHTPKTIRRDTSAWSPLDHSYSGAGGAALTNWARAVITVDQTAIPHVFAFMAAKRGARIGWRDESGGLIRRKLFAQNTSGGAIYWKDATTDQVSAASVKKGAVDVKELLMAEVPTEGAVNKDELIRKVNAKGPGVNRVKAGLNTLLESNSLLQETLGPRSNGRRPKMISLRRGKDGGG